MLSSSLQLPLFDDKPLPLLVAEKWNFNLRYEIIDGVYYFRVHEWLSGLVDLKYANQAIRNLRRNGFFDSSVFSKHIVIETASNKQQVVFEYITDVGLYKMTQEIRVTESKRENTPIQAILDYLAESGAFVDIARREPQKARAAIQDWERQKERSKLINEGYTPAEADEWLSMRQAQQETHRRITSEWQERGAKGREFGRLTNEVTEVATGKTATKLKKEMGITDSPRKHLSTAQNAAIQIVESLSVVFHSSRNSHGVEDLAGDIQDVKPIVDAALPEIERALSKKPRRLKGQDQPKLIDE